MLTYKGQTYKVVVTTPAGRRRYLEIFKKFIYRKMDEGVVDGWQLWQNTVDIGDIAYLASMEAENPRVKRYFLDEAIVPSWESYDALRTFEFFHNAHDDDTIYVRFDDDIVWAADDAIEKMVKARIDHPDAFAIYPNIINSTTCNAMHQQKGVLSQEAGKVHWFGENDGDPNYVYLDAFNYTDSKFADLIHETFRKHHEAGTLSEYYLPSRSFDRYERFSICSLAWWGKDKIIPGRVEEPQLSWEMPDLWKRPVWFCGDALMVHYAYHTHRPYLDGCEPQKLDYYKKITK